MPASDEVPIRGFIFWCTSPLLVVFIVLMPFLIQIHTTQAMIALVFVELLATLLFLGLFNSRRFWWASRGVGGLIFLGYLSYLIGMLLPSGGQILVSTRQSQASAFNALLGLAFFGLPGLCFALFGRLTWRQEPESSEDGLEDDEA